jgi:hypothetical protein
MSAYAMPGLFPPLPPPVNHAIGAIGESCGGGCSSSEEEKIDYSYHYNTSSSLAFGSEVKLAIREAKVDSSHLILKTLGSGGGAGGGRKRRPGTRKLAIRPEELAIQFEMDIAFNGRECTVVRSFYRLSQLRDELVEEMGADRIPEFPMLPKNLRHNLTLLKALLRPYVPLLEDWLRRIFWTVSMRNSPTLTHFVLEPLCFLRTGCADLHLATEFIKRRKELLLESIAELDEEDDFYAW